MIKEVSLITKPHSLVCSGCAFAEKIKTEMINDYVFLCHKNVQERPAKTCNSKKTLESFMKTIEKEHPLTGKNK